MQDFLRKFSTVPNEFIDDFFGIVPEKYDDSDIAIDFDKVVKWLEVRKDNLKRLLVKHFSKDIDYKISTSKKYNVNNHGANYVEIILISPDCFKELCMISLTQKAKEVRLYYLALEKLVKKYHEYIKEKLYKKIGLLEENQKPKVHRKRGIIYFFEALNYIRLDEVEEHLYKLGETADEDARFSVYNSETGNNIKPLFILEVDDLKKTERCIKNLLEDFQYRKRKEIYQINMDALKLVFDKCDNLVRGFKHYIDNNHPKKVETNLRKMRHSKNGVIMYFKKN